MAVFNQDIYETNLDNDDATNGLHMLESMYRVFIMEMVYFKELHYVILFLVSDIYPFIFIIFLCMHLLVAL